MLRNVGFYLPIYTVYDPRRLDSWLQLRSLKHHHSGILKPQISYSIGDVDSIPSEHRAFSKTRRKRGRLCQSNIRHKSLTPAGSSTTQELVRFRIPDENPESFPFSQFGWRRIKLLGLLLRHCSTLIRHPSPELTKLRRGSRRCRCAGILQLQNWQASRWISALYPAGCASLGALRPASIGRCDDCWNRCHCHLLAGPHIKLTTLPEIIPETKHTFVQARRQT